MTTIFVAKLDFGVNSDQLKELFEQHGTVLKANVATDRETGKSRGFGFVEMPDAGEASTAIRVLDGYLVNGRPIAVKEAEQRGDTRPAKPFVPGVNRSNDDSNTDKFDNKPSFVIPIIDSLKIEPRKKVNKDKKSIDKESDNRSKKPKMDAYKKSGKKSSFFNDDDDIDDDLLNYKRSDEDDDNDD
jgi:RNA recognition motif-containing protein